MSQIHTDPERLRAFAGSLKRFAELIDTTTQNLNSQLGRLGDTWRDQEYDYFTGKFAAIKKRLNRFVEETRTTAPQIERDARDIEEYLKVRPD